MGAFYGNKILSGELNDKTGTAWKIEDVPKLWRDKTKLWLDEHKEE